MASSGRQSRLYAVSLAMVMLFCFFAFAQSQNRDSQSASRSDSNPALVARGKYIVDDVAVCSQCHTPRDAQGNYQHDKWLEGAPVWLEPASPESNWPLRAPRLAGNPPGTDVEMVKLLTTGIWRNGTTLRPPMPQFQMSVEDAHAVVAYLKF